MYEEDAIAIADVLRYVEGCEVEIHGWEICAEPRRNDALIICGAATIWVNDRFQLAEDLVAAVRQNQEWRDSLVELTPSVPDTEWITSGF